MFKIISNDEVIGYANEIRYIRKGSNGCYQQCQLERAQGIAFKGTPYSLEIDGKLEGAVGTASILQYDDADEAFKQDEKIQQTVDGLMETFELTTENADNMADVRTALIELYELIKGEE